MAKASAEAGAAVHEQRVAELDGVRGLAILSVVVAHAWFHPLPGGGMVGVHLFFVLSGYLITGIVTREHARTGGVSMRGFYERRARRLLPALLVFLAVYVGVAAMVGAWGRGGPALLSIFYVANWARVEGADFHEIGHMWSLAVEEQFYLVWPLVLLAVDRWASKPAMWVAAMLALSVGWRAVVWRATGDWGRVYYGTDTVASSLLFGALAAHLRWRVSAQAARVALAVLATVALLANQHENQELFRPLYSYWLVTVIGLAAAVLILGAKHLHWLAWPPLVTAGLVSYGWYLWHVPVLRIVQPDVYADPHPLLAFVAVGVSLGVALASRRWVEARWLHRRPDSTSARSGLTSHSRNEKNTMSLSELDASRAATT